MAPLFSTILVTGCGGDIGLGIGRILKMTDMAEFVVGCDIHDNHPGKVVFNECDVITRADSPDYFDNLVSLIRKYSVDLFIPTAEPELRSILEKDLVNFIKNTPVLIANKKALEIGMDKLKTAEFLKAINVPYPWTKIVKDGLPEKMPCIIKSRFSSGSKSVNLVTEELIDFYSKTCSEYIWQEYLQPDDQEYTCGLYRAKSKEIRTIIFKRVLVGGRTGYGEVVYNADIQNVLTKIAEGLDLFGSINVQLRLTSRGPVIFEINPRFSSTVVFRHLLGFCDLIWSLKEISEQPLDEYIYPQAGTRFYRMDKEIIIS